MSLFDEENQKVLELAGSTQINAANERSLKNAETKLQEVAQALRSRMDLRQKKTTLQERLL